MSESAPARRSRHATISIGLTTYLHVIPAMQEDEAAPIAGLMFAVFMTRLGVASSRPR